MKETEDKEPIEVDFDAMSNSCMSSIIGYSLALLAIFLMALYLKS